MLVGMSTLPLSGLSHAHVVRARSKVGINYGYPKKRFYGRVRSWAKVCRRYRTIRIIKVRKGISDLIVRSVKTGPRGRWKVRAPSAQGRFYTRTIRNIRSPYGHYHRCRGDTSRLIGVRI
jgi:hypothetical protein